MREDDCIVVDGGGNVLFSCLQNIKSKSDNRIVTGAGIGCMGSGLPEAIGACMASGKRTLCFIGDGSMQFNIQELQTIIENKLPILIVIFNNNGYLAIKNTQDNTLTEGLYPDSGLSLPNYQKICNAYGINYTKLSTSADYATIKKLFTSKVYSLGCRDLNF